MCSCTYDRGWLTAQRRCGHPSFGDSRNSRDTGRCQRALMSMWDSLHRSRSISKVTLISAAADCCGYLGGFKCLLYSRVSYVTSQRSFEIATWTPAQPYLRFEYVGEWLVVGSCFWKCVSPPIHKLLSGGNKIEGPPGHIEWTGRR
jgi:hypothetical protein